MQDKYIGKRLDGRYEIHELVGVGGMAYVYLAYDKLEDRWVAVKILKEEFSSNSDFLRRFRNESKAIALLSCENIVKIFDVSFGDQIQYIVMEYLDGITLKQYIEQQGTIRWQEAIHFMTQILNALECAHEKGIIHRDIKPQNIILMRDGTIKVTDFGIARFLQNETQTMTDTAIGSVHYISPEQAKGGYITDRADIYSTGVMLYEMLTGKLPFVADSAVSVALMQLQAKPVLPREINPAIPLGLEEITMHAMEKNPANRFSSAAEMLADIEKFRRDPNHVFRYETSQDAELDPRQDRQDIDGYETVGELPSYDDNYEYEEELVKSKRRRNGGMVVKGVIIAIVVILAAVGITYGIKALQNAQKPVEDTVTLPDFINKNYDTDIKGNPEYSDFTFKLETGNDPDKEAGLVLNQSPTSGISVKKGREVTLIINKGEEEDIPIPDLTGQEQTAAVNALLDLGLKSKIETIPDDNVEAGYVIKTDPTGNSAVKPGTTVLIYVSKGKQEREIPVPDDLVGNRIENATAMVEDFGLTVGQQIWDDESDQPNGTVISVSPESGTRIKEGESVDFVISSGKGAPKTVSTSISLPNVDQDVTVRVYRNGTVEQQVDVNLAMAGSLDISMEGKTGTDKISVKLDDQLYMELSFDYDNQTASVDNQYEFKAQKKTTDSGSSTDGSSGKGEKNDDQ